MNKSKIEWTDYTWNPVTGCLHGCEYCYARRIAERFGLAFAPRLGDPGLDGCKYDSTEGLDTMLEINKPYKKAGRIQPFPIAFMPTFHRYRLDEPQKIKKPSKIFVSSMGDLFGDWVPDEWIGQILQVIEKCSQHKFLFLTKNPKRYLDIDEQGFANPDRVWLGTTVTSNKDIDRALELLKLPKHYNTFLSIEPLLGPVDLDKYELLCKTWRKGATIGKYLDWVIIGQQTGPGAVPPKDEWVQSIIDQCRAVGVPVFVKPPLYEQFPIQEWSEGLK